EKREVEVFDVHEFELGVAAPLRDLINPFGYGFTVAAGPRTSEDDCNFKHYFPCCWFLKTLRSTVFPFRSIVPGWFALSECLHLGHLNRDIQSCPRRKLGRLPACYFVRERNSVGRIRTQVGMNFPVSEHLCQLGGPRKQSSETLLGYLFE